MLGSGKPLSRLLASPLITLIIVPYTIPYVTPFKEFRLYSLYKRTTSAATLQDNSSFVISLFRAWGVGFRVPGSGFRVQRLGFRVQGLGFRV